MISSKMRARSTVNPRKEQTFMAGWIAFRYLKKLDLAERHFKDMAMAADGPLSRAKAAYWLGRIADARGDKQQAATASTGLRQEPRYVPRAARHADARSRPCVARDVAARRSDAGQIEKLLSSEVAKALVLASKADLSREYTRTFLAGLRNLANSKRKSGWSRISQMPSATRRCHCVLQSRGR